MQTIKVEDCWLTLQGGLILPVASFEVNYQLNSIPQASIVPALGREIMTGTKASLLDVQEGMTADLYLKLNGSVRKIISGYVMQVSGSDNATMFTRSLSARIVVIHKAVKLAGAPPVTYEWSSKHHLSLATSALQKATLNPLDSTNLGVKVIDTALSLLNSTFGLNTMGASGNFIGSILKIITGKAMINFNALFGEAELDALIKTYNPANVSKLGIDTITLGEKICMIWIKTWREKNCWEALRYAANYCFLDLIPFNEGFYIGNPFALKNVQDITVTASEYVSIQESAAIRAVEPINGVIVQVPTKLQTANKQPSSPFGNYIVYPPTRDAKGKLVDVYKQGGAQVDRYYHYVNFPDWLLPVGANIFGAMRKVNGKDKRSAQVNKKQSGVDKEYYVNLVSTRVAQYLYGKLKADQASVKLVLPYRENLMPGTIVKVENTDTGFLGNVLYGMVKTTSIKCDTLQKTPALEVLIELVSIRDEEDNKTSDKGGYGIAEHPIFEGSWAGIDLFGNFISQVPTSLKPAGSTMSTHNSSATGKKNPNTTTKKVKEDEAPSAPPELGAPAYRAAQQGESAATETEVPTTAPATTPATTPATAAAEENPMESFPA